MTRRRHINDDREGPRRSQINEIARDELTHDGEIHDEPDDPDEDDLDDDGDADDDGPIDGTPTEQSS